MMFGRIRRCIRELGRSLSIRVRARLPKDGGERGLVEQGAPGTGKLGRLLYRRGAVEHRLASFEGSPTRRDRLDAMNTAGLRARAGGVACGTNDRDGALLRLQATRQPASTASANSIHLGRQAMNDQHRNDSPQAGGRDNGSRQSGQGMGQSGQQGDEQRTPGGSSQGGKSGHQSQSGGGAQQAGMQGGSRSQQDQSGRSGQMGSDSEEHIPSDDDSERDSSLQRRGKWPRRCFPFGCRLLGRRDAPHGIRGFVGHKPV